MDSEQVQAFFGVAIMAGAVGLVYGVHCMTRKFAPGQRSAAASRALAVSSVNDGSSHISGSDGSKRHTCDSFPLQTRSNFDLSSESFGNGQFFQESSSSTRNLEPTTNVDGTPMFGGSDVHGNAFGNTDRL